MTFWFDRHTASNSLCGVERFLRNLRDFYPGWRIWSHRVSSIRCGRIATFALPVLTTSAQLCSPACAGSTRTEAIKSTLNSGPGGAASQNSWNAGSLILFSTLMTGSCRRIFSRKGSTRRIGFAPWRATATLATGCHLSNTWPRATSWLPPMRGCKQFQTSNWRRSAQNAVPVFACLTSAWRCNAFPARNWCLR